MVMRNGGHAKRTLYAFRKGGERDRLALGAEYLSRDQRDELEDGFTDKVYDANSSGRVSTAGRSINLCIAIGTSFRVGCKGEMQHSLRSDVAYQSDEVVIL